jgi:leader peptidase (prepilin peptidase)/N-methyltransferase
MPVSNLPGLEIGFGVCLLAVLIWLSLIDIKTFRLPNVLTFPLIGLGLIQAWILDGHLLLSVIGAVVGYLVFYGVEIAFKALTGKDGLGRGDAKLLAAGGAWCGALLLPTIVLVASMSGLVVIVILQLWKKIPASHMQIPFGPYLALAISSVWFIQHFAHL